MEVDQERPRLSHSVSQEEQAPLITIIHSVKVSAVHRLWASSLSEESNLLRFGEAVHVHGHDYNFRITFKGPVCKRTGQIIGNDLLEDVVSMAVTEVLDRKNLDTDISFFLSRPSTIENVCLFIFRNVGVLMRPHPFSCTQVEVEVGGCYRGPGSKAIGSTTAIYSGEMCSVNLKQGGA
ncbi:hypothetical protein BCR35DRAFT_48643 [Leucosporidium creatinivorum]|uniref:6-pyruvoyltetrahydropterin synthase n=1 Tax=Leucosporidium creatinivorum TaxID=106004 RepID=A0A1Y2FS12_9BASI|nr:hypothetical protein BCR35DRAFT_48643 [Leucosporidium creatinivorum]